MNKASNISHLYILSGGRSRRFGSDKALAEINGVPILQSVVDGLRPYSEYVTLITGQTKRYEEFGTRVITDKPSGVGPIGGLRAALTDRKLTHGEGWLLLAACDLVQPHKEWIKPLIKYITSTDARAIAYRGDQWEPMLALYHTDLLPTVDGMIRQHSFAMYRLLVQVNAQAVDLPDGQTGIPQVNTLSEFVTAQKLGTL